jgi:hypothetical protein
MKNSEQLEKIVEVYRRREEIEVGRPLTWALEFGLFALVITAFWLLLSGAELDTVLARSIVGFLVFAGAGYAAGRLLEKPPVPEPLTLPEEEQAAGERAGQRLSIDALRPGMVLAEPVRKSDGEVLISKDTTLSKELLGVMREYEIPDAVVNAVEEGEEHNE